MSLTSSPPPATAMSSAPERTSSKAWPMLWAEVAQAELIE